MPERRFSATQFYVIPAGEWPAFRKLTEDYLDQLSMLGDGDSAEGIVELTLHANYFDSDEIFKPQD